MRHERIDRDSLPDDVAELERLRARLSDSLFSLQKKIKMFSNELGESYNDALNNGGIRHYSSNNDLIMMSNYNDRLMDKFADLGNMITTVEYKIDTIKKNMRDS